MAKVVKTKFYSWKLGKLVDGCKQCIKGRKLVLYVTGLCHRSCYFCPLSDNRKDKDIIWANERLITKDSQIIEEAKLNQATGAGITGGEPLLKLNRTIKYIKILKKEFGKSFHIHLYTSLELLTFDKLKKLYTAGLDEIRFHPDLDKNEDWEKVILANNFDWNVGVEIPVIPNKYDETIEMIDYFKDKITFLNLNELEISDNNANSLNDIGFQCKDNVSYGIKGSENMAFKLLDYCKENSKLNVHYCTCKLKDKVQLGNRLKLRAKGVKKDYDVITKDGTLFRGIIFLPELKPDIDFKQKIKTMDTKEILKKLKKLKKEIMEKYDIPDSLIELDKERFQILTGAWIVEELKLKNSAFIEEYPTQDRLIVAIDFL